MKKINQVLFIFLLCFSILSNAKASRVTLTQQQSKLLKTINLHGHARTAAIASNDAVSTFQETLYLAKLGDPVMQVFTGG